MVDKGTAGQQIRKDPRRDEPSQANNVEPLETTTHSFVVKIWLEESGDESRSAAWRGHITHVPSGKRRYLEELGAIGAFIAPYLVRLGVRFGWEWQYWLMTTGQNPPPSDGS